ncbi:Sodium-dependent proline transporter [Gossypium arboreum]|uniref:Sodium-dependent proline transporter n=1 Tax=Gossypium arboreum TaxID=29729 RepID=A0A0B0PZE0_GOSAR|nr:Sodium-dependent proline transporter [Gossypium arboreum]
MRWTSKRLPRKEERQRSQQLARPGKIGLSLCLCFILVTRQ